MTVCFDVDLLSGLALQPPDRSTWPVWAELRAPGCIEEEEP
jgi:hypothetical protein